MTYVKDLEEEIHRILQSSSKLRNYNSELRDKYIKQEENFDRERKGWDRDRKTWSKKLGGSKAENDIKSKKIRSLESMIEILEGKLSSSQKDVISIQNNSSKKETEITSLKSKIAEVEHELASKVSELECLKSETISNPILGGNDEKNMIKSDDISAVIESSKDLSQYFLCRKKMDPMEKIDGEITELPKNDTKIDPKISDETSISEINKDNMLDILIKPNASEVMPQIPIGAMRPSLEALPLPVMTSMLMSPLSAYIFLVLLIIAVMWFMVLRRTWNI
ncbi:7719_t:CDS:1, partial [Entrophospora sp. SA101]